MLLRSCGSILLQLEAFRVGLVGVSSPSVVADELPLFGADSYLFSSVGQIIAGTQGPLP